MAEVILMPRLSDTMTEGVIAAWHKNVGDQVKKGDLLAEIETDKATMELESYQQGVLLHRGATDGEKLQVNDLLAIIGKEGEDVSALVAQHAGGASAEAPAQEAPAQAQAPAQEQKQEAAPAPQPQQESQSSSIDISKMEEVVLMPRLSDTMTEGVIATWQKKVGEQVKKGDVLAEIETDKATMELESYKDGVLLYQGANEGDKIAVNDLLCIIGKEGMDIDAIVTAAKGGGAASGGNEAPQEQAQPQPQASSQAAPAAQPQQEVVNEGRIIASPLAKKLAEEKGVDLRYVKGSGDNGRIVKQDVDAYQPSQQQAAKPQQAAEAPKAEAPKAEAPKPAAPKAAAGMESYDEVPVSQMRKTIARRLAESKFSAPHFYLTMSIDMDKAVEIRGKLNEISKVKISFNDMVLKAVAVSLKQHPKVNSSWLGDKIRYNHHVNIGVAVAVDEGLLVPVVRNADMKGLSAIAAEVKEYAQKAKDKKLQPSDWEGSTFTISNLGMFGIDEFTAIINPPDACILAVGGISKVPVVKNGAVVPGNVMKVTLSCDHRVVDGASGAAFLQTLKSLLEEPMMMMV
ncbi:pyruvate dehydrogenase complex dihydrolipoamide acetyltransferase [Aridibaculum aurantiacum]|uniref:pyruvate dehydrogenase complex dihydrolipoamide acetyltransferase n=1 Tax=Aridibaculum aurantiacum TaxID=2810307 RepID=UPI001A96328C|nr:pyruvate dehydrogenase complex dihydrolipoamide acetyltransferase [Aridibaculum aurantiacum]